MQLIREHLLTVISACWATVVTRGVECTLNKSQHRLLTLEKTIFPQLLPVIKSTTFHHSTNRAIPNLHVHSYLFITPVSHDFYMSQNKENLFWTQATVTKYLIFCFVFNVSYLSMYNNSAIVWTRWDYLSNTTATFKNSHSNKSECLREAIEKQEEAKVMAIYMDG